MIITAQLMGGIGNQMFQIAAAKGLTLKLKDLYPEDYKDVECCFDFNKCDTKLQGNVSNTYKDDFFRPIPNQSIGNLKHKFKENGFKYSEIPPVKEWSKGLELFGYFQSSEYFNDYRNDILNTFYFSEERIDKIYDFLNDIGNDTDTVTAVHVRRGDYLKNTGYHPTCTIEYYKEAMKRVGDGKFVFISDDIEWCKENFKGDNIVIGPKSWFGPKGPQDTDDVLLKDWVKI